MNSFHLKLIACTFMVLDHVGYIFFPEIVWFRIVGRLSMPIFAFLIGQGYQHTKNLNRYMLLLLAFALISQPVYSAVINNGFNNIFFSLFLGLAALTIYQRSKNKKIALLSVVSIAVLATAIKIEYGFYGVLMTFILGSIDVKSKMPKILGWISLITILEIAGTILLMPARAMLNFSIWYYIQIFAIPSLIFMMLYNGKRGPAYKYLFYFFYPGHLAILGLIKYLA